MVSSRHACTKSLDDKRNMCRCTRIQCGHGTKNISVRFHGVLHVVVVICVQVVVLCHTLVRIVGLIRGHYENLSGSRSAG